MEQRGCEARTLNLGCRERSKSGVRCARLRQEASPGTLRSGGLRLATPRVARRAKRGAKIGVTGGKVETRIADAKNDATFLLADVDVIATYKLSNINRTKLENLIHRIFDPARLDIEIKDRFGNPVIPREWFLVPLFVIDEAVDRIKDGSISDYVYDPKIAKLIRR